MNTPKVVKENRFYGTKVARSVKFMGQDLDIHKLTVAQVMQVQDLVKQIEETKNESDNIKLLIFVIKEGAPELRELSDDDLYDFPMDELSNLSTEIMKYSGLMQKK